MLEGIICLPIGPELFFPVVMLLAGLKEKALKEKFSHTGQQERDA